MTFQKSPERPQEYHSPVEFNKEYNALKASLNKRRSEQGVAQVRQDLIDLIEKYGRMFSSEEKEKQYEQLEKLVSEKLQALDLRQKEKTNIQGGETEGAEPAEVEKETIEPPVMTTKDAEPTKKVTEPPKQEEIPEKKEEQKIKPFLELFRADNLIAENAELTEEEKLKIKSFDLFKQRALEFCQSHLEMS